MDPTKIIDGFDIGAGAGEPRSKPSPFTDDSKIRKDYPIYTGFLNYFPDAVEKCWEVKIPSPSPEHMTFMLIRGEWDALAKASIINLEYQLTGVYGPTEHSSLYDFLKNNANAVAAVCKRSKEGNDKHLPGEPLYWAREKSGDHKDCIARHLIDEDWVALAWRALANLQIELEENGYSTKQIEEALGLC